MGYSKRGTITDFWPDNDENTLYISAHYESIPLAYITEQIKAHFGEDIDFAKISIEAEHINTSCLYYDRYDSSDYTNFLVIRKDK